jgi:hypothetical protein
MEEPTKLIATHSISIPKLIIWISTAAYVLLFAMLLGGGIFSAQTVTTDSRNAAYVVVVNKLTGHVTMERKNFR